MHLSFLKNKIMRDITNIQLLEYNDKLSGENVFSTDLNERQVNDVQYRKMT